MPETQDSLRDALTDIRGVGEATADTILETLDSHGSGVSDAVSENLRKAHDEHRNGDAEYAGKFVRRAIDALDE